MDAGDVTDDGTDGQPDGHPGNRIGSALATEMVIALTQLRSHARTHARNANATEIDFLVRGRSNDGLTPPTSDIRYYIYLREFGVQTTVIAAPVRWGGLLPAVLVPGLPSTHVAQTLCFSRFIACPPRPLAF